MTLNHPIIRLQGSPFERGLIYGSAAAKKVAHSIETYSTLFAGHAGLSWEKAVALARQFEGPIQEYLPSAIEEMKGIAQGAGVTYGDILALNCRSEIMFARPDGCSVMAVLPESSADGHTYLAQTWDWIMPARASTVILDIRQDPLPRLLMVAEAGMVGGKGFNDKGIGVALNALTTGKGRVGVPLHILYRGILNASLLTDAMERVTRSKRAGCGNFTIASAEGLAFCMEYTPENFDLLTTDGEPLYHTNHYLSPLFIAEDKLKFQITDTYVRLNRIRRAAKPYVGKLNVETIMKVLGDHANCPDSVCSHEDMNDPVSMRMCSVYAVVMDLNSQCLWVTNGYPCEGPAYPVKFE